MAEGLYNNFYQGRDTSRLTPSLFNAPTMQVNGQMYSEVPYEMQTDFNFYNETPSQQFKGLYNPSNQMQGINLMNGGYSPDSSFGFGDYSMTGNQARLGGAIINTIGGLYQANLESKDRERALNFAKDQYADEVARYNTEQQRRKDQEQAMAKGFGSSGLLGSIQKLKG